MRVLKAVAVVSFLFVAVNGHAASWVVSTSGNDANAGTLAAPFRTINKAAGVAKPGDEVVVRGGIYNGLVSIGSQGTAAARIVFKSYPGELAILDGAGTEAGRDLVTLYKAAYVDFSGFEVRNATKIGICAYGANNVRITGNDVHHSMRNGIYAGYGSFGLSYDITIDGNRVHDNVLENEFQAMTGGGWAATVVVSRTDRATIANNRVHNNYGEGIDAILSDNVVIRGNTVSDSFSVGIYLDNAQYTTVDRNFVYSTGDTRHFRGGYPAAGIQMANETYSTPNPLTDITVTNNIVVDTKWGFYYGNYETGGGMKNVRVANNTFHKSAQAILAINSDTHSNSVFENNIFHQGSSASVAGGGVTYRNNNWYAVSAGSAGGPGDVLGNPALQNPGGLNAPDYKVASGSAALAAAYDASTFVQTDHFGNQRALPFDIGAHQLSSGAISDTQPPSTPSNVSATATGPSSISLSWAASSDNVGVTSYRVYRNNAYAATVGGTSWSDSGLAASTTYSYQVYAYDAAGNQSAGSSSASATTQSAPSADTQAPTTPASLRATGVTTTSVALAWTAASDNVGVVSYRVYRDGSQVGTTSGTTFTDTRLRRGSSYTYSVRAVDAAGNLSATSNSVAVTTARK